MGHVRIGERGRRSGEGVTRGADDGLVVIERATPLRGNLWGEFSTSKCLAHQILETTDKNKEVLSLDLEKNDFLYRMRRASRMINVSVLHEDIIPVEHRTESARMLSKLRDVLKWDETWTTLTVRRTSDGVIQSAVDEFRPHSFDPTALSVEHPIYFNILDLESLDPIIDRILVLDDKTSILKVARF